MNEAHFFLRHRRLKDSASPMSASAVRAEVVRNRHSVEIDTITRLMGSGKRKNVFEMGYRGITPNFVQADIPCERKTVLPERKGPLRVDFEIAVMSDLMNSVYLQVDVPPIEVTGHTSTIAMTVPTVPDGEDFILQAVRTSDNYAANIETFTDPAYHSSAFTANNGISLVPILTQISDALRSTTDSVFAGEFSVSEGKGETLKVSASFEFKLRFSTPAEGFDSFLTINGLDGFPETGFVTSETGRSTPTEFATWVWGLGFAMIERLEVILDNQTIETVYGDYLHFHEELHGRPGKSLEAACFRYKGATLPEMMAMSKRGFTMHVPIPTFFSRSDGAAPLPIQKMRDCNMEMKFRLHLRPLEELSLSLPDLTPTSFSAISPNTSGVSKGGSANLEFPSNGGPRIFDGSLSTDYVVYNSTGVAPGDSTPFFLTYDHGSAVVLSRYRLFRNTSAWPKSWYVQASTDNTNFVTIDTTFRHSDFTVQPTYTGSDPENNLHAAHVATLNLEGKAYRYYRWAFTSTSDTTANFEVKIRELQLFTADSSVAPAPVVANTWSDFEMQMWAGMTLLEGAESRALQEIDTSHVVKLVEPLHMTDAEGYAFQSDELRLDLRLRHPTSQLMWAIADDARLERSVDRGGLRPFTKGVGQLVGPFCDVEDTNVLREGHKMLPQGFRTSADVQTTPRLFIPGNRFEYRGCNSDGQEVEPLEYVMLQMNRQNRFEETMPPEYYRLVTPFSNRRVPLDDQRIYTYAFTPWASDPHRLNLGSLNFGAMHEKVLQIKTRTKSSKTVRLIAFAETYNVFLCGTHHFAMKYV